MICVLFRLGERKICRFISSTLSSVFSSYRPPKKRATNTFMCLYRVVLSRFHSGGNTLTLAWNSPPKWMCEWCLLGGKIRENKWMNSRIYLLTTIQGDRESFVLLLANWSVAKEFLAELGKGAHRRGKDKWIGKWWCVKSRGPFHSNSKFTRHSMLFYFYYQQFYQYYYWTRHWMWRWSHRWGRATPLYVNSLTGSDQKRGSLNPKVIDSQHSLPKLYGRRKLLQIVCVTKSRGFSANYSQ